MTYRIARRSEGKQAIARLLGAGAVLLAIATAFRAIRRGQAAVEDRTRRRLLPGHQRLAKAEG